MAAAAKNRFPGRFVRSVLEMERGSSEGTDKKKNRRYETELHMHGVETIFKYDVAFCGKAVDVCLASITVILHSCCIVYPPHILYGFVITGGLYPPTPQSPHPACPQPGLGPVARASQTRLFGHTVLPASNDAFSNTAPRHKSQRCHPSDLA